jgi:FkbM family methyltransferase
MARQADSYAIREIVIEEEYAFLKPILENIPVPVVIDMGANIGLFSLYVFALQPRAKVVAFEPARGTFDILARNQRLNPDLSWDIQRYAGWGEDGEVLFQSEKLSTGSHIGFNGSGDEEVPAITLETLLRRHLPDTRVDLLKVDIEGAEEAFLAGSAHLLPAISHLLVEVHPERCRLDRVVASLRGHYRCLYRMPGRQSQKPLVLASKNKYPLPEFPS